MIKPIDKATSFYTVMWHLRKSRGKTEFMPHTSEVCPFPWGSVLPVY